MYDLFVLPYFSQAPRNLEAPGFMKDFEDVLNQVKNLIVVSIIICLITICIIIFMLN